MDNNFKEKLPEETIKNVFNILFDLNLFPAINYFGNPTLNVYSTYLATEIDNRINVFGKGITPHFSLASACGELMERIQTYSFFDRDFNKIYFQDEIIENEKIKAPYLCLNNNDKIFFDVEKYKKSTTGMAAGNTYSEAVAQGLCEILERTAVYYFFQKKLIINSLINYNVDVYNLNFNAQFFMFDVSLYNVPIAMLVALKDNGTTLVHFGCAPTMEIACERCFTEFMQGYSSPEFCFERFNPILNFSSNSILDYFFFTKNGKMFMAKELLDAIFIQKPPQNPSYKNFKTNEELIQHILKIKEIGNVYIRDFGFLGFPTVQIIIPNLEDPFFNYDLKLKDILEYLNCIFCSQENITDFLKNYYNTILNSLLITKQKNQIKSDKFLNILNLLYNKSIQFNGLKGVLQWKKEKLFFM